MKLFLLIPVFLFSLPAFSQTATYKDVNAELRTYFKIKTENLVLQGNTGSGSSCQVFIKDQSRDPSNPVDEILVTGQFRQGVGFQNLSVEFGPDTSSIQVSEPAEGLTFTVSNNPWLPSTTQSLSLSGAGTTDDGYPSVTFGHQGSVGASDFRNTCGNLHADVD